MHVKSLAISFIALFSLMETAIAEASRSLANAHRFEFALIKGDKIPLSSLKGKVVLVVNTASKCGFTPQYAELQMLYDTYGEKGLVVIGVPSTDFGGQEFDKTSEILEFTEREFAISFPLTAPTKVSGNNAHPFYKWASKQAGFFGKPKWNFHKYLIDKNGNFVTWFSSKTSPMSSTVNQYIQNELSK